MVTIDFGIKSSDMSQRHIFDVDYRAREAIIVLAQDSSETVLVGTARDILCERGLFGATK